MPSQETIGPAGPAAEPQLPKKAVPPRKRVHEADPEGRSATRRATEPQAQPMAVEAAFWAATPVVAAPDAAAAPSAGAPATRERAGRATPLQGTAFDYGDAIKSSF